MGSFRLLNYQGPQGQARTGILDKVRIELSHVGVLENPVVQGE